MVREEWKKINGFSNYMVSNLGRIKRLPFKTISKRKNKKYTKTNREIILNHIYKPDSGMTRVVRMVSDSGKIKLCKVHRIVGAAFLGTAEVRHKTLNFDDNSVKNLIPKNKIKNCK
jgi:hypothetical protein